MAVNVIPVRSSTLRDIVHALKKNRFVAIVADQHDPTGTLIMNFLGRPASVARGPASFAMKYSCPLMPFLMRRETPYKHRILAGKPIFSPIPERLKLWMMFPLP